MKKLLLISAISALIFSACTYWIVPPYTSVEKIAKIQPGMTIDQVNSTLGIPPYDIYHIQSDGSSVLTYNYRNLKRKMILPVNAKKAAEVKASESAQTNGAAYYDDKAQIIYVLFENMKVKSMISTEGLSSSEYILVKDNNLKVISKKEYNSIRKLNRDRKGTNVLILDDENRVQSVDLPVESDDSKSIQIYSPGRK